uniref:Putative ABC multidrug resistance transporter n=1 Tax=Streptomyces sp. SANK 60405 TaxID=689687 RepID=D4QF32_9ACTN|nr:putative ABC multidrug resistance transporter [Streptomyces sp. SANK 60405]
MVSTELRTSPSWALRLIVSWATDRRAAVGAVTLALAGAATDLATPLLIRSVVDGLSAGRSVATGALVLLTVAALLRFAVQFGQRTTASRLANRVQHELRVALLSSVCRYSGQRQDAVRRGEVVSRSVADLQVVQSLLALAPQAAAAVLHVVIQMVIMFVLSPVLALATLVTIPLAGALVVRSRRRLYAATWLSQQATADVTSFTGEAIAGLPVTKVFGREELIERRFLDLARDLYGKRQRVARLNAAFGPGLAVLPQFALVLVIGVGGAMTLRGEISVGTFIVFAAYLLTMTGLIRLLAGVISAVALARSSVERIHAIIDSAERVPEPPAAGPRTNRGEGLGLQLSDVGLTLGPDGRDVLRGVSIEVSPGECLGVVGRAGSGKSVLGLVLQGQYRPSAGRVELIGSHGRFGGEDDSGTVAPGDPDVVLLTEEPFLFSGTVRDNVLLGRKFDADRYASALTDAAVDPMLERMADGDRTSVGEGGAWLSGGERQRIALARALYNSPRLLVLDDATSALDTLTEARVFDALRRRLGRGCTMVVTGRRRAVLSLADRIAVVEGGRIVEQGDARELLRCSVRLKTLMGEDTPTPTLGADEVASGESQVHGTPPQDAGPGAAGAGEEDPAAVLAKYVAELPPVVDVPQRADVASGRHSGPFGLRKALLPVRPAAVTALVCITIEVVAAVALPAVARAVLGRSTDGDATAVGLLFTLGLAITAVSWIAGWGTVRATTRVCDRVLFAVRLRCFRHIQRLPLSFVDRARSGNLLTRMTADVDSLSAFLQTGLLSLIVNLQLLLGVALMVVLLVPGSWPALTAAALVVFAGAVAFRRIVSRSYPRARELLAAVNADLHEKVHGVRTAQIFRCTDRLIAEFAQRSAAYRDERQAGHRAVAWFFPLVALAIDMALICVLLPTAVAAVPWKVSDDGGTIAALVLYLSMLYYPIQQMATVYDSAQQAGVGLHRINGLLAQPVEDEFDGAGAGLPSTGGALRFDRVGFTYRRDAPYSLLDVVLDIRPGQSLAVVGPTGAGKSTIVKLLARFYRPQRGAIRLDGVDIATIPLRDYRRRAALVPQEAHLFSGSVGENIAFGRPGVSRAEIMRTVRAFGASEMIASLPGGLDYDVGPRGSALSAGQRQVVALLRAIVSDPDLLLLDEATCALDLEAERSIVNALREGEGGRKTVVVAHRLATAAQADVIAVVERGRLLESGGHEALLRSDGLYADLWAASEHDGATSNRGQGDSA